MFEPEPPDANELILWLIIIALAVAVLVAQTMRKEFTVIERPTIVCLCGSTRFSEAFRAANLTETLAGKIVLTIGCDMRSDDDIFGHLPEEELANIKSKLDELHLRKIDIADEVLILNVAGYIGQSTRRELEYAISQNKRIRFLEETSA